MGKSWHKSKPDIGENEHRKSATRSGHSHKYKYSHGIELMPAAVKRLRPEDLLEADELDLDELK